MDSILIETRILDPIHIHKSMDLGRGAPVNTEMMISLVGQQAFLSVERVVWAEEIENLEETLSIKYPENTTECLKDMFYKSLIRDWNHTESLVAWLKNKFPVKHTIVSKKCVLKTRAKYPEFNYKALPENKFGPEIIETVAEMARAEYKEE